jgi:hypothetical protein
MRVNFAQKCRVLILCISFSKRILNLNIVNIVNIVNIKFFFFNNEDSFRSDYFHKFNKTLRNTILSFYVLLVSLT